MTYSAHPALLSLLLLVLASGSARGQDVRIRLLDLNEPVAVELSAHDGTLYLYAAEHDDPLAELTPGRKALVERTDNQLHVRVDDLRLYAQSLRVEPDDDALFGLSVEKGNSSGDLRRYAGQLKISADVDEWEMKLVNSVPLEDYVASVVASEYGFDDLEGSKAMAVLVRTYTLGVLGKYGPDYDHVDHTLSQVYRGVDAVTPVSRRAAEATRGEVVTYGDDLIRAVYFSSSGGHTADNETVWDGPPLPYLRGRPDPYGDESPHHTWSARLSRARLLAEIREAYGRDVEGFLIDDRSADGRVTTVALLKSNGARQVVSANDFRLLVIKHFGARSVRSTLFDARRVGDEYVFEGRGFGHGVGLSQWGAHDMAQQGMQYQEILKFYYSGVVVTHLDGDHRPDVPARVVSSPEKPAPAPQRRRRIGW